MKRPSSTSNSSSSTIQNNFENDKLLNAKTAFLNRVSDGISYLIHRHGYSRARATNLILTELRKEDPLPSDDEVSEYRVQRVQSAMYSCKHHEGACYCHVWSVDDILIDTNRIVMD